MMNYRNAKRLHNGWIDCEINHETFGWIHFTCDPNDTGAVFNVAELYGQMDTDPETAAYVPPTQQELEAALALEIRMVRDHLLQTEVDPVASNPLRWNDLSAEQQQAWSNYRRALLDITTQEKFPHEVTWPTKPE